MEQNYWGYLACHNQLEGTWSRIIGNIWLITINYREHGAQLLGIFDTSDQLEDTRSKIIGDILHV
jgi:hypothetical protein